MRIPNLPRKRTYVRRSPSIPRVRRSSLGSDFFGTSYRVYKQIDEQTNGGLSKALRDYAIQTANRVRNSAKNRPRSPSGTINRPGPGGSVSSFIPPSIGGAVTYSRFSMRRKMRRYLYPTVKSATMQSYSSNSKMLISSAGATGRQVIFTSDPWTTLNTKNYLWNLVLNGTDSSAIATTDYNKKVFYKSFWASHMFTNYDQSTCFLDIYVMKPRDDTSSLPSNIWQAAFPTTGGGGADDIAASAADASSVPGVSPWSCRSLLSHYKIVKKISTELQQGCTHKFNLNVVLNKVITGRWLYVNSSSFETYMPVMLIVVKGTPVHDQNDTSSISTSKIKVDMITQFGARGCIIGTTASQQLIKTNLVTNIATEQTLNVGTGTLTTD